MGDRDEEGEEEEGWDGDAYVGRGVREAWMRDRGGVSGSDGSTLSVDDLEGEVVYGVSPVLAALSCSRRDSLHALFVQEGLEGRLAPSAGGGRAGGVGGGTRKDKQAALAILRAARSAGVPIRTVSKHQLNLFAGNRPHQGFVLDAAPLRLSPLEALPAPGLTPTDAAGAGDAADVASEAGTAAHIPASSSLSTSLSASPNASARASGVSGRRPVWVALDEVSDPQNLGAVLRSVHFLGAQGVVLCAKNSAPLSAVVSKASAGAVEDMEVRGGEGGGEGWGSER